MNTVRAFVPRLIKDQNGAGMVEYSLLVSLIGVVLIGTLVLLEGAIDVALTGATDALNPPAVG